MSSNKVGYVLSCAPRTITIAIDSLQVFEANKASLQVGRYLTIAQGNSDFTVATIKNVRGSHTPDPDGNPIWQFQLDCQAVGTLVDNEKFERGSLLLPVPTEPVYIADDSTLDKL